MRILAFDSGSSLPAVGTVELLGDTAHLLNWQGIAEPRALARELVPTIGRVLEATGWSVADLDVVSTTTGPGSWTSLRVGLATAKTLAQVQSLALVGVPSFDAIAAAAHRIHGENLAEESSSILLVASPCSPAELYGKLFLAGEDYLGIAQSEWIAAPERHLDAAHAQMLSADIHSPLLLAGESAAQLSALMTKAGEAHEMLSVDAEDVLLHLATAGAARVLAGETDDYLSLTPLYLADSNAERNLAAGLLKPHLPTA